MRWGMSQDISLMRFYNIFSAGFTIAALTLLALPSAMRAQERPTSSGQAGEAATLPANPDEGIVPPDPALAPNAANLGTMLLFDPSNLTTGASTKPLKLPNLAAPQNFTVTHSDRPDGSGTIIVKQALPGEWNSSLWDAHVGADLGLASAPTLFDRPDKPLASTKDINSGAAWASLGIANLATVGARVDPANDQGRLDTTLNLPVGRHVKVTLQDTYSVMENASPATASVGLPLMSLPQTTGSNSNASQVFGNQQAVKFDFLPTGTSLGAAFNSSNIDPTTHKTLSADQKLLGPLHVTTAVTDVGQPTSGKSITAGFKLDW